jgi:hypothetical protein
VVTEDELMKMVWPDTFVEEANLSRNIFMLRKALGETAQDRYIVTVPGREYRLAENVHLVSGEELTIVAASHSRVQVDLKETKPWRWVMVAAVVLLAAAAGATWLVLHRPAGHDLVFLDRRFFLRIRTARQRPCTADHLRMRLCPSISRKKTPN